MQKFEYFSAQVNRDERPDFLEDLKIEHEQAIKEVWNEKLSMLQSNSLVHNSNLSEFKNYLLLASVNILQEQGYDVGKYDFYLQGLWAQEVKRGGGTAPHIHKNSQICGWFFVEVPENSAYVVYHDTRVNKNIIELDYLQTDEQISNATGSIFFNNLMEGTVLFNNSWVSHQLVAGTNENPTRCFHFIISHKERMCNIL